MRHCAAVAFLSLAACSAPVSTTIVDADVDVATARATCMALPEQSRLVSTRISTRYVSGGTRRAGGAPDGVMLPGHCVVTGSIQPHTGVDGKAYATGFELSLPDRWNGRFLYLGGGGNDGVLRDTSLSSSISSGTPSPLSQGYAVVSTDAGHSGTSAAFGLDPRARVDHAFDSHYKTAASAKALIAQRYGRPPAHSYFSGCSGGGRQGMMFSQRFPEMFDAITAGAPAMRVASGATVAAMWNTAKLTAIAPTDAAGHRVLSRALSNADLALLAKSINASCDAADGVVDGMIQNIGACRFDPAVLRCQGAKSDACLSGEQVAALSSVFAGVRNRAGRPLYFSLPWDPGVAAPGWRQWTLGSSTSAKPDSRYVFLMVDALVNEFMTPPDPGFDYLSFDVDKDPDRMAWFSAIYDTFEDTQLAAFRQRGGKLLCIHGMADPIFSAHEMLAYYEQLAAHNGGLEATRDFARAFVVPGMNHCSGGPATDNFDSIQAMVDWVEHGQAPERIAAWSAPNQAWFANRTRPLCAYPEYARYSGSGSIEDAANFVCTRP